MKYEQSPWRFIPLMEASGKIQMAIDSWLMQKHREGNHPPTLRFYTWLPAAISLGYHQRDYPSFWDDLQWQGHSLDIVRRPTGGRAVLHQGDLTYAVVTSAFTGSRVAVYEQICQFLIVGWRSLGIELSYGQAGRGYIHHPSCFTTATRGDLINHQGHKFIGSAQLRQGKAILQHGSMVLFPEVSLFSQVFGETFFPPLKFASDFPITSIIQALLESASSCFGVELIPQPLLESEWQEILASAAKSPALG